MRLLHRKLTLSVKLVGFLTGIFAALLVPGTWTATRLGPLREAESSVACDVGLLTTLSRSVSPTTMAAAARKAGVKSRVRIFCLILTQPSHYETMATSVNNTWARRCDKYYFIGTQPSNVNLPVLNLPLVESRDILWKKVRMSFEAVYARERMEDFDFFLKADDDTYVVLENLRRLLWNKDPNRAAIFGRRFAYEGNKKIPYMSGGAGYVLSREAVRVLVSRGFAGKGKPVKGGRDYCNFDYISVEDWLMGRCLKQLGVKFENSLDESSLERFHPLRPETMTNPKKGPSWLKLYNYYPFEQCVRCISNTSISFHYVHNIHVLEMEFLLYHIQVAK